MLRVLISLIKQSATPPTIIYPYPVLALLVFSFSKTLNVISLFKAISISFIFYGGINLWNHVNDVEDDAIAGKRTILTESKKVRKFVFIISPLLYLVSFIMYLLWTKDYRGIFAFFIVVFATWIYSDKIIIGRKIRRWKEYYVTEILTYLLAIPSFTVILWTLFNPLSFKVIILSVIVIFFMLSGVFLKDIKDATGDCIAGLKTLAVVFPPETLLKASLTSLGFYYFFISFFSLSGWFPLLCLVAVTASIGYIYTLRHFLSNNWNISLNSIKPISIMIYSSLASVAILIVIGICCCFN